MRLLGKKALVTGASLGIGAGIALALAQEGADVVVNYNRSEEPAKKVCNDIKMLGRESYIFKADVGIFEENRRMVNFILEKFKTIDILVNNAGISIFQSFFETTEDMWDKTLNTNLKSVFMLSQLAAEIMKENGGGSIVNISSSAAHGAENCLSAYCASKGGVTLLTLALSVELAPYKIRVNALAPGVIDIKRNRDADPELHQRWQNIVPLGSVGKVEEVAKPVVFLCSDEAAYITGQVIYADGGLTSYVPVPQ